MEKKIALLPAMILITIMMTVFICSDGSYDSGAVDEAVAESGTTRHVGGPKLGISALKEALAAVKRSGASSVTVSTRKARDAASVNSQLFAVQEALEVEKKARQKLKSKDKEVAHPTKRQYTHWDRRSLARNDSPHTYKPLGPSNDDDIPTTNEMQYYLPAEALPGDRMPPPENSYPSQYQARNAMYDREPIEGRSSLWQRERYDPPVSRFATYAPRRGTPALRGQAQLSQLYERPSRGHWSRSRRGVPHHRGLVQESQSLRSKYSSEHEQLLQTQAKLKALETKMQEVGRKASSRSKAAKDQVEAMKVEIARSQKKVQTATAQVLKNAKAMVLNERKKAMDIAATSAHQLALDEVRELIAESIKTQRNTIQNAEQAMHESLQSRSSGRDGAGAPSQENLEKEQAMLQDFEQREKEMMLEQGSLIEARASNRARAAALSATEPAKNTAKKALQEARAARVAHDNVQQLLQRVATKESILEATLEDQRSRTHKLADHIAKQVTSLEQSVQLKLQHDLSQTSQIPSGIALAASDRH